MNTDNPHLKCHLKSQIILHICPHHHVVVLKLRCRRSCHNANKICAIIDDGCNSCCYGEVWRQNAATKMKVLRFRPIWLHRKETTFNGVGMSTTSGKFQIPITFQLQESDMVIPGCTRNSGQSTSFVVVPGMFVHD